MTNVHANWLSDLGVVFNYNILPNNNEETEQTFKEKEKAIFTETLENIFQGIQNLPNNRMLSKKIKIEEKRKQYIQDAYIAYQKNDLDSLLKTAFFKKIVKHTKSISKRSTYIEKCAGSLDLKRMKIPPILQSEKLLAWVIDLNKTITPSDTLKMHERLYGKLNPFDLLVISSTRNRIIQLILTKAEQGKLKDRHLIRASYYFEKDFNLEEDGSKNPKVQRLVTEWQKLIKLFEVQDREKGKESVFLELTTLASNPLIPKEPPPRRGTMQMVVYTSYSSSWSDSENKWDGKSESSS